MIKDQIATIDAKTGAGHRRHRVFCVRNHDHFIVSYFNYFVTHAATGNN